MKNIKDTELYHECRDELQSYEDADIPLYLNNQISNAKRIAKKMIKESQPLMRDYVANEKGKISELHFHEVKNETGK